MTATDSPDTVAWVRLCRADALPTSAPARVTPDGDRDPVCVVRITDGAVVALRDQCPHRDIALSDGVCVGSTLVCPGHFWRFDLVTGRRTDTGTAGATVYPVRTRDGWVEAQVPERPPVVPMRQWLLTQAGVPASGRDA